MCDAWYAFFFIYIVFPELCTTYICTDLKQPGKNGLINRQIPTSTLTLNMCYIDSWYDLYQDCRRFLFKVLYRIIQTSSLSTFRLSSSKWLAGFKTHMFGFCILHSWICFLYLISRYQYTVYHYIVKPDVYGTAFHLVIDYTIFHLSPWQPLKS